MSSPAFIEYLRCCLNTFANFGLHQSTKCCCLYLLSHDCHENFINACLFLASKSSAKIQINVKQIEPHLTTTDKPSENNKIWLQTSDTFHHKSDKFNAVDGKKSSFNGFDQPTKVSKGKWNSNKQNAIGNEANFEDKPSKSDKWNIYRGKENDHLVDEDYFYWDSINNHVEKDESKKSKKVSHNQCILSIGKLCRKSINYSFYLMHSRNFPLQVEVLVIVKFVFGYLRAFLHFR